jgi:phosphoribosylanthranilate isomerase
MTRTRIKFCGMTRLEDALVAAALGADAIGLVFTRHSKRFITPEHAAAIRDSLPPLVSIVALFMDDQADWVATVERALRPDLLQFHGVETPAYCESFDTPYLKAVAMAGMEDVVALLDAHPKARGFLLDGHAPGEAGGSGQRFDWSRVPGDSGRSLMLAGGLHADNVADAIRVARPWGVDVSSGIESAPGIKDPRAMRDFIVRVRKADQAMA